MHIASNSGLLLGSHPNGQTNNVSNGALGHGVDQETDLVNVRVCIRCRPLMDSEKKGRENVAVVAMHPQRREVVLGLMGTAATNTGFSNLTANGTMNVERKLTKTFTFDKVFDLKATQEEVYYDAIDPLVNEVLEGYNGTVFACVFLVPFF